MAKKTKKKLGPPMGNQNRKGYLKPDRLDDQISFRCKSEVKAEIESIAESLGLSVGQHIIRSATGKR